MSSVAAGILVVVMILGFIILVVECLRDAKRRNDIYERVVAALEKIADK